MARLAEERRVHEENEVNAKTALAEEEARFAAEFSSFSEAYNTKQ
jgi:hypothetical protein